MYSSSPDVFFSKVIFIYDGGNKTRLSQYAVSLPSQLKCTLACAILASLAGVTLVILKVGNKPVNISLEYEEDTKAPTR